MRRLEWQRVKFSDESGGKLALPRLYGRAPRGKRAGGSVPIHYSSHVTLLGALRASGLEALMTVEGATDGEVFGVYVRRVLGPHLRPGDMVVMDNLRAPKVSGVREALERCGATLLYVPPYWPDLSPIERGWSKLKAALRAAGARTRRALDRAIKRALSTISAADAVAWFAHCGYQLN